ncbi:MAG: hypothetical protein OEW67_07305 [Cyclobacteriaceae bacterium]|nr:hypothetical protein [Cyclobacteriaceae bacterium]
MKESQDPIESIVQNLKNKSCVKQKTYNHLCSAFEEILKSGKKVVKEIKNKTEGIDHDFTVDFKKISNREFHIKVAGDLVVFVLHTNIITFAQEHTIIKSKYVGEDENRRYFGQIMIYNFMADSVKYNRMKDSGYLLGRVLINYENHFFVEGEGQLNFMFNDISSNQPISKLDVDVIVKLAITTAIKSDLIIPPFQEIKRITLYDKLESTQSMGGGRKIGFQMSYNNKVS